PDRRLVLKLLQREVDVNRDGTAAEPIVDGARDEIFCVAGEQRGDSVGRQYLPFGDPWRLPGVAIRAGQRDPLRVAAEACSRSDLRGQQRQMQVEHRL